jgi:hypothetical protein
MVDNMAKKIADKCDLLGIARSKAIAEINKQQLTIKQ